MIITLPVEQQPNGTQLPTPDRRNPQAQGTTVSEVGAQVPGAGSLSSPALAATRLEPSQWFLNTHLRNIMQNPLTKGGDF